MVEDAAHVDLIEVRLCKKVPRYVSCFACEAGKFQSHQAQEECDECELGGFCPESAAVPTRCTPGTFGNRTGRKVQADCFTCPAGSACVLGAENYAPCPAGTFANVSGTPDCLEPQPEPAPEPEPEPEPQTRPHPRPEP